MPADGRTLASGFPGATGDGLHGLPFPRDPSTRAAPRMSGRVTVPVLGDSARGTIVSNERAKIIRMFNAAFDGSTGNLEDCFSEPLCAKNDERNTLVHDAAVLQVFAALDLLELRLSDRRLSMGDTPAKADRRLSCTLVRFDPVCHLHFKCNRRRIIDDPNLWACARALYRRPGMAETVRLVQTVRHHHGGHENRNPHRIIPINPALDFTAPHGR